MQSDNVSRSSAFRLRAFASVALCAAGAALAFMSFAATPPTGTITSTTTTPLSWVGSAPATGAANGESSCIETGAAANCDTFTLTVGGLPTDWTNKRIEVRVSPPNSYDDYDLVIHKTSNTGPIIDTSANGAGITEVAHINPASDGVGIYTVHVIYFTTVPGDQYLGSAAVVPLTPVPPPAAALDSGPSVGYENFEVPPALTPVTTSTGSTVEYMGRSALEPSIGINPISNVTNFQSDLETLFITFSNGCVPGTPAASWINRAAPTSQVIDSDPIGFTDLQTGRVFAAELSATSPTCKISYTDDDGVNWIPTPGPLGSGIDHQTIGGGPFHTPLPGTPTFPRAFYYCSQDLVTAFCLRSDDGGLTWGAPVPTYTTECGGLHGHVKVSPKDGTVYLPNKDCGGQEAAVVSEDNGITWNIRRVTNATVTSSASESDPSVAIDSNGRVYFALANADASAVVGISDDHGVTWSSIVDLSGAFGLQNIRYPTAIGGDTGRAAIAYLGTTTPGSANAGTFNGVWHLYIAHTFDGGAHWNTSDATPNAPMQRGCIWTGGGANICRNLADFFDISYDKNGRVQVGYPNGCPGGDCAQSAPTAIGNGYAATATIARQSSGRRLLAAFDPPNPLSATSVPGMPSVTARRAGAIVRLAWSEADTGNSAITAYQILRGSTADAETLLATVSGTQTKFTDTTAINPAKTYYYKVVAVNAIGSSCANNEIAAPYLGDPCTATIIHQNDPSHPESTTANSMPQLAIDYVAVGEPAGTDNLMFKMKVTNLTTVPPNSRWRFVWDSFASEGQQFYAGMRSDTNGAVTFEYGTIATAVVGLVLGVPTETPTAAALPASNYQTDGTITVFVPKSGVGNPQPGDLLGAMNGRTFAGDTAETGNLERSTTLIDHTFVKGQTDNAYPAATYTVIGSAACSIPIPLNAVSRKLHASQPFDIALPFTGEPGIECRFGSPSGTDFQVVVTFPTNVTVGGVTVSSANGAATATRSVSNSVVTIDLHNVADVQTLGVTLTSVSDGTKTGDVSVPVTILAGDTNADGRTNIGDTNQTKGRAGDLTDNTNFRSDVNLDGRINVGDTNFVKAHAGNAVGSAPVQRSDAAR